MVLLLGLGWRLPQLGLSLFVQKYGADALWSLLVYLLIRFARPGSKIFTAAVSALAFSFAVELSQLYHAPWIDAIRATRLGALILGSVFNWPDLPAYAVGVAIGGLLDAVFRRRSAVS